MIFVEDRRPRENYLRLLVLIFIVLSIQDNKRITTNRSIVIVNFFPASVWSNLKNILARLLFSPLSIFFLFFWFHLKIIPIIFRWNFAQVRRSSTHPNYARYFRVLSEYFNPDDKLITRPTRRGELLCKQQWLRN